MQVTSNNFGELWTVTDLCNHLKIGKKKAYNMIKDESFPSIKIGNEYRIPKDLYFDWLKNKMY
jgi:excisionase family DNA binding protein